MKKGGAQIAYTDQDPRIPRMYLDALAKNGVQCRMSELLDEKMLLAEKARPRVDQLARRVKSIVSGSPASTKAQIAMGTNATRGSPTRSQAKPPMTDIATAQG